MALQAGQLLGGNSRVVRLLGEGGFGEVYLVENRPFGTASTTSAVAIGGAPDTGTEGVPLFTCDREEQSSRRSSMKRRSNSAYYLGALVLLTLAATGCTTKTPEDRPTAAIESSSHALTSGPGTLAVLAGKTGGPGSADGTGAAARFNTPYGVAVDGAGNVYVADTNNNTIRKITPAGVVTTLAGTAGQAGSADGTGAAARFNQPQSVAVDGAGNVYVADTQNHTIRKVTPAGVVSTLAGTAGSYGYGYADGSGAAARFRSTTGVAVDGAGNVYVADYLSDTIRKVTPAGVVTTLAGSDGLAGSADGTGAAARFYCPTGVAVDGAGNVYVADRNSGTIRKVTSAGVVSTLAGTAGPPGAADGTGAAARFNQPEAVAVDGAGNVYVADRQNMNIRKVTPTGVVTTLAGFAGQIGSADGTGSAASFWHPSGVALDGAGHVYVADTDNNAVRKVTAAGVVTSLAGSAGQRGNADGLGAAASFNYPQSVAVDGSGNVYVADEGNNTIRKVTPAGVVTTLAGFPGNAGSADGVGLAARFAYPYGVAVDESGTVYVADSGNETIRKITPAGVVTTLAGTPGQSGSADGSGAAARFNQPAAVAVDGAGNVYVTEKGNHTIRKVTPAGVVTTLAGAAGQSGSADGTGAAARFSYPWGVAVDGAGNVYVADSQNDTIRKVTPAGVVTTLAGTAGQIGSADGAGAAARFNYPCGVAVDGAGNVYVADDYNSTIRRVTPVGVVTTVVGVPPPASSSTIPGLLPATLGGAQGVAVNQTTGNLYIIDAYAVLVAFNPLTVSPTTASVVAGGQQTFTASAGAGIYTWSLSTNNSGGSITSTGSYTAGSIAGVSDTVSVADSLGALATATVFVTAQPWPDAGPCQCNGSGLNGPVTVSCGESACGSDYTVYSCDSVGWTWTGQACGGNSDAGRCQCQGTGAGDVPVTVSCGQSACGSDYVTYACGAGGWTWTGQSCGADAGASCQCDGTGPGGAPVSVSCGQSACGSDYNLWACSAAGWSWTGQSCDGGGGGAGGSGGTSGTSCECVGTGPQGAPVTATCGQSACGSDYIAYACDPAGWSWTGQSCNGGGGGAGGSGGTSGTSCECVGTGPQGAPVTATCGASACGSDYNLWACSAAGWSWTGQPCGGGAGGVGGGGAGGSGTGGSGGGCEPESDAAFCVRIGRSCGTQTAPDNCGLSRTAVCGGPCSVIDFEAGATIHVPDPMSTLAITGSCNTSCVALGWKVNSLPFGPGYSGADSTPGIPCIGNRWTYWLMAPVPAPPAMGWSGTDFVELWLWDRGCNFVPPVQPPVGPPPLPDDFGDYKAIWVTTP
jgi:hypothetical protein